MRIVVVEDEPIIRNGLINIIKKYTDNHIVGSAINGLKGIQVVREVKPDIVITDINMPDMDGLTMLEVIKKEEIEVQAILLTGYSDFIYTKRAIKIGVFDYLLKPIDVDDIINVLSDIKSKKNYSSIVCNEKVNEHNTDNIIVLNAIKFINSNYNKDISLLDVSHVARVTPEYLSKLFTQEIGVNFSTFLGQVRINEAKKELARNKFKIYEIAELVGFNDTKYFNKVFKSVVGVTPSEFRKELNR